MSALLHYAQCGKIPVFWNCICPSLFRQGFIGQLISKWLFGVFNFFQKMSVKKSTWGITVLNLNSFIHFFEETLAWKNHFDFVWPLIGHTKKDGNHARICFSRTEINFIVINITLIVGRSVTHKKNFCSILLKVWSYSKVRFSEKATKICAIFLTVLKFS